MYTVTSTVTKRGRIVNFQNTPYLQDSYIVTLDSNNRNFNVTGSSPANFTMQLPTHIRQIRSIELRQAIFDVPANMTNPNAPPATVAFADNVVAIHVFFNGTEIGDILGTTPAGRQTPTTVTSTDYSSGAFGEIVLNVAAGGTERYETGQRPRQIRRWSSRPHDGTDIIGIQLRDTNDNLWLLEDAHSPVAGTDRVYMQFEIVAAR